MSAAPAQPRPNLVRHANFRRFWLGDTVSSFGSAVTVLALPLVAIETLDASPFEVGLLTMSQYLAFLVLGLPAGAWVDRMNRRLVLIGGDVGRAVLLATVPLATTVHALTMGHLFAVALLAGVLRVFFVIAYQTYLPEVVDAPDLVQANARLTASRGVAEVGGPGLAGYLVSWLTAPLAIAADSVSFLVSALFVARIRTGETAARRPRRPLIAEVGEGARFVLGHPLLRAMVTRSALFNLSNTVLATMFVVLLADELNLPASTIGLVFTVAGGGAVAGALIVERVAAAVGGGRAIVCAAFVVGLSAVPMPFTQHGWPLWLAAAGEAVGSAAVVVSNVTQISYRQRVCPKELLGRVNATTRFVVWGAVPLGALLGGVLGQGVGIRPALWIGVVGELLAILPLVCSPLWRLRRLDDVA
ncbi:MFS transporter [Amycolatopsis sp. NPDC051061]|uniref:MFS transporter n=1 Tax=Amycolatopsis sp. NPDC051061 TaxID=3155042 RepID=UPI0034142B3F